MAGNRPLVVALFKSGGDSEESQLKDRYLAILEENHLTGVSVPTLSFQFQLQQLKQCLLSPEKFSGLLLTSQRSVEAVKEAVGELPDEWRDKRHYCVGIQTRDTALNLLGSLPHLTGEQCGNADNLSQLILAEHPRGGLPILFPCSSLKMDTLPRILKANHIGLEIVTSYVTVPHPQLEDAVVQLASNPPNSLVFFSPSGVNFALPFLEKYNLIKNTKVVSIGNTTAKALDAVNIVVDQICEKPTPDNLMKALRNIF